MRIEASLTRALLLTAALGAHSASAGDPPPASPPPSAVQGYVGFHVEPLPMLSAKQKADLGAVGSHDVVVALVIEGGPAATAGVRVGDFLLKMGGKDVPRLLTTDRYDPRHHEWRVAMRVMMADVKPGVPVELGLERAGKPVTVTVTPATEAEIHKAMGGALDSPPDLASASAPEALSADFEGLPAGAALPAGFWGWEGRWQVVPEPGAAKPNTVLRQDRSVLPWAALLVTGKGRAYADARVTVRFKPVSGVADASGGIVFRAQDGKNYYLARANSLEDNFQIHVVKDGVRTQLGSVRVTPPSLGEWHTMEVTFTGATFHATLDGKDPVEATDATWSSGWAGLWTKADSVTLFDDLHVTPIARPPVPPGN